MFFGLEQKLYKLLEVKLMKKKYKLGFDVGGTFTDGVLTQGEKVISKTKSLTTADVTTGIINALDTILGKSKIDPNDIIMVSFGTTHTTNAIIERKKLNKVGIFRLAAPATTAIPPLTGWPEDLIETIGGKQNVHIVEGGSEYDGRDIMPLDEEAIREACKKMRGKIDSVAITGVFSPMITDHEDRAAVIVKEVLGEDINITLSNKIASISILERENSTILNAAVINVMRQAVNALKSATKERNINAPLFIVQNDGSVMDADYAVNYPIFTVASGPAASVRGSVFLSRVKDGLVVDVGGTSTDVAYIVNGFPRESSITVNIGGVKTNIRCPDLLSIALGGGTIIKTSGEEVLEIGPESVGHNLVLLGKSFGGPMLTVHDIAVGSNLIEEKLEIFDTNFVTHQENIDKLSEKLISDAYSKIKKLIETSIDQMKTTAELVPAIFIGGGSIVIPKEDIAGTSEVIQPEHFEVGGAIGTTIAEIGAYAEGIVDLEIENREEAIEKVKEKAKDNLVSAGGIRETAEVIDVEEIPFAYMPGKREKIRIRLKGKVFQ
jgi:N-methylhydantoinase A/oxoprolinase/acetone carboxylase beta subunit